MPSPIAVVLAAGKGTRMKSDLPKVLVPVLGRPMIHWVIDALQKAGCARCIVVVGYRADDVKQELAGRGGIDFALQSEQLGTGHAVQMCRPQLSSHDGTTLVVAGDSPLIQSASVARLLEEFSSGKWACLLGTLEKDNPVGLGRIVRDQSGKFERIIEQKDATPEQQKIREVNMSTYLFKTPSLLTALSQLSNSNAQGEFYLTDCPEILRKSGQMVDALPVLQACEALSINTMDELGIVEEKMQELGYSAVA
jgi:bifunctional UDP-N-acetylglucosamine pyrophosphorylase / glucosamine-1-phosphate N-acetyltransferase